MKKLISLVLVIVMLSGILAGCGQKTSSAYKEDSDEEVTLTIAIPWSEQKDFEIVEAEINKQLETLLPHTKVELLLDNGMADKWTLWMSTKKAIDIAHSGYVTNLEDEIRKETYLELNDLVEEYAPTLKDLRERFWYSYDNATISGELYAIPNVQYYAKNANVIDLAKDIADHIDMKALKEEAWASDKTTEKFYEILTAGFDKAAASGVDMKDCINLTLYNLAKRGYHFIGGADSNLCYDNSDSGKIIDFYTTDEFVTFCKYMKIWAGSGYVSKDILTGQWSDKTGAGTSYAFGMNEETGIKEKYQSEGKVSMVLGDPDKEVLVTNIGDQKTYWSIPFTSAHPVRAIRFLDLLHSEKGSVIANLLAYGIEGQHYEVLDAKNGNIKAFEYQGQGGANISYGIPNWLITNMMQGMYNVAPYTNEFKEYGLNYYDNLKNMKKHILCGFSFDVSAVRSELSQLIKNNKEYAESVYSGIVDNSDGILAELQEKNKAAGQEKIMQELQKQADEYIASLK